MATSSCLYCKEQFKYKKGASVGKYCSNNCQQKYQHQVKLDLWFSEGVVPGVKVMRRYLHEQNPSCSECGISEWKGKPIGLEMDHIDGHYYNNDPSNLRLLCPNCHSQTSTFRNKNKGNGRPNRNRPCSSAGRAPLL